MNAFAASFISCFSLLTQVLKPPKKYTASMTCGFLQRTKKTLGLLDVLETAWQTSKHSYFEHQKGCPGCQMSSLKRPCTETVERLQYERLNQELSLFLHSFWTTTLGLAFFLSACKKTLLGIITHTLFLLNPHTRYYAPKLEIQCSTFCGFPGTRN
jgi:hypothetical protein